MAGNTRLTITGQLVDIKRLQGPGHGENYNPDFEGAGGPGGKFLYQDVRPNVPQGIKKVIFIVDFVQQEGINAPGAILTGNIQAALNFAEGIVDFEPTGSDAFTFGNSLSTKPFEVVMDGFSIPSTDIGYISGPLPGTADYGSQGYAIFIKNSTTGNDVIHEAVEQGINDYTGNPFTREHFFNFQVYYKMYVNADNTIAWCRKPIDIPHAIGVPIGQVYGINFGNMGTDLNTLGLNDDNADGTTFGTGVSEHMSGFYFLRQGLHIGTGELTQKNISGAFYTPKNARTFDPFNFSSSSNPASPSDNGGLVSNQDTSRFAWNTQYLGADYGQDDPGEYSIGLHDQYFVGLGLAEIKDGNISTDSGVPIYLSSSPLCDQAEFLFGNLPACHDCPGATLPGLRSGVLQFNNHANLWRERLWPRLGEYVFILNTPGRTTNNLINESYGPYKYDGSSNPLGQKIDPFSDFDYQGSAGYIAMYFSFADNQETIPDQLDIEGCTHPTACNYNANANIDDGTCTFPEFYIYAPSDITSSAFTVEGSSGNSLLTGAVFSLDFGDNAELNPYDGTNNPFYNGATATTLMIYIEVSSGETVSNYNFRIFQLSDDSFTAYNPVTQEALSNVSITVDDGSFAESSTGGTLTVTVTDMGVAVEEGVMSQVNIIGVEVASTDWLETETLCSVESNFFVNINDTNITGCTDENALNYNPDANITNNDLCEYCNDSNGFVENNGGLDVTVSHNNGVPLSNSEYAALELAAGDIIPDTVNVNLNIQLLQPAASMLGVNTFGIVVFDPTTVTNAAQAAAAFTTYTADFLDGGPFASNVLFTDSFNLLNTSANDNVQTYTLNYPFDVNSPGEGGYFYYVYPLPNGNADGGLSVDEIFEIFVSQGCVGSNNFVLKEGVCNDCGIGITNCVEVLDPITQFINNDLCDTTTDCGAFDTSGSVNFIPTELYTSPSGETVNCSGYFDIQVNGPAGMIFSVKVSSSTGQINDYYLTGVNETNYSFIPDGAEGVLTSTGVTLSLEEVAAITGSQYAFGDYEFEFSFYIALNVNNDTFNNLIPQVGNPNVTVCPETYTYSLTENDVEICGCTIQTAENYNPQATFNIYGECGEIPGCIDPTAINFNDNANIDNGTCQYSEYVCTDPDAINYVAEINPPYVLADNTLCQYIVIFGCTDPEASNYNPLASIDNGTCLVDGEPEGPVLPPEIPDFEAFLVYLQHCLQYKGEKYFSAMLTGKTVDEDRYLHLSMINDLLRTKAAACLFDGEDTSNARLRQLIKVVLTYCEDCRERSGILKSPYGVYQDTTYMPGTTTYTGTPILNLGGPGGISLGGGGVLGMSSSGEAGEPSE